MNVVATGQWGKPKSDAKHDFCGLARGIGTVVDFGKDDFVFREGDSPRYKYVAVAPSTSRHGGR